MMFERLKKLRENRGLSQENVAQILKMSRSAYSMHEINQRQMSYESLCILADYYNVSVDYLLGRRNVALWKMNKREQEIVEIFRNLDEHGKQVINAVLELEGRRMQKE